MIAISLYEIYLEKKKTYFFQSKDRFTGSNLLRPQTEPCGTGSTGSGSRFSPFVCGGSSSVHGSEKTAAEPDWTELWQPYTGVMREAWQDSELANISQQCHMSVMGHNIKLRYEAATELGMDEHHQVEP